VNSPSKDATAPSLAQPDALSEILRVEFRRNMGQISRQSITFFLGTLFTMAGGYLVKVYVARVLGAEQLGLYALGMTLVSVSQLVGILGLHQTAGRYVAVYNATKKFDELRGFLTRSVTLIVFLNLFFSIVLLFVGGWVGRKFYHSPDLAPYIPLFAVLGFLGALNVFYCQILAGLKDVTKRTVILNFIGSPLLIALTVGLLALGTGMWGYLAAQIVSSAIVVALLVALAWKLTAPAARFSLAPLPPFDPEIKAFAAAAFGMGILDFLVAQGDKILLGLYLNASLVGIYVLASTLSAFVAIILQSVNQIFAPVIADLHAQERREVLEKLFQTLTKWVLGLTLPLAVTIIVFARPLMGIFGPAFEAGWSVLVIGAVGQIVNCGVGSVGYLLLMSGNQRRLVRVQFAVAGISILINVTLIPLLGIVGAALAAAFANVAANLWNLSEVRKALRISPYNRSYFALLIPAMCATVAVALLRTGATSIAPWIMVPVALVVSYGVFVGLVFASALDPDDRMIVRSAWTHLRAAIQK
jgi:O-antigen/teichoic acid export membrane protein